MKFKVGYIPLFEPSSIAGDSSAIFELCTDSCGYNIRNELIFAVKSVRGDACPVEAFGEGRDPGAPQFRTFTTEYAYQYDDIGNRISSLDLGANRTYIANNLNQYLGFRLRTLDFRLQVLSRNMTTMETRQ